MCVVITCDDQYLLIRHNQGQGVMDRVSMDQSMDWSMDMSGFLDTALVLMIVV